MTTVGYGDLTSALNVGRMLAMVEAVFGQLYLITVVSLLVQNLGTKHQERREAGKPRGAERGVPAQLLACGGTPEASVGAGDRAYREDRHGRDRRK